MAPTNKKKKQSDEDRLRKKREAEKKRQERIKADPELLLREKEKWKVKYKNRKEKGQVKLVKEMNLRELRAQRKAWKQKQKKQREKLKTNKTLEEYLLVNSLPGSNIYVNSRNNSPDEHQELVACEPTPGPSHGPSSLASTSSTKITPLDKAENHHKVDGRKSAGSRRKMRKTSQVHRERDKYKKKYEVCLRKMRKYQKRYERFNTQIEGRKDPTQLTPKTKVKRFLKGRQVDAEFGKVVQTQLSEHYQGLKTNSEKKSLKQIISTKHLKKYRMVTAARKLLHCGSVKRTTTLVTNANEIKIRALRHQVRIR